MRGRLRLDPERSPGPPPARHNEKKIRAMAASIASGAGMRMTTQVTGGLAALCVLTMAATPAMAQAPAPAEAVRAPRVAVTRHEATFNGQKLHYTATVAESFVSDASR